MATSYIISDNIRISFHTYHSEDLAAIHWYTHYFVYIKVAPPSLWGTIYTLNIHITMHFMLCLIYHRLGLITTSEGFWVASPRSFNFFGLLRSPELLPRPNVEVKSNIDCWIAHPRFLSQQFGAVYGNEISQPFMHLRSRCLPRPSASSPLDNRARLLANTSQALNLEGLHREIHGMAE